MQPQRPREVAEAHRVQRQYYAAATAAAVTRRWTSVDEGDIARSWARQVPSAVVTVGGGQLAAAQMAEPYVQKVLAAQGLAAVARAAVSPVAFAGVASDGRDLAELLFQPAITALMAVKAGWPVDQSLAAGRAALEVMARTQVADAGRDADQAATVARPELDGYVRLAVGATCNRCLILAGRVYEWSTGFLRHPLCDCVMIPAVQAETAGLRQDPRALYDLMTPEERSQAGWSRAEQKAIADGADITAVTNIHREGALYTAGGRKFTREGARGRARITPEQIYRDAGGDRDEAIRLLRLHKYIR